MLSKESQLAYKGKKRKTRQKREGYDGPEAHIQQALDDALVALRIEHRRIEDSVWCWLVTHAPIWAVKELSKRFKSKPDSLMLIPLTKDYSLALEIELKNKYGNLNDKQEDYAKKMPVHVCRSIESAIAVVQKFQNDSQQIRKMLENAN